jgi:hypothetical protein
MAEFRYMGMTVANQTYIHKEIKTRTNKGNV